MPKIQKEQIHWPVESCPRPQPCRHQGRRLPLPVFWAGCSKQNLGNCMFTFATAGRIPGREVSSGKHSGVKDPSRVLRGLLVDGFCGYAMHQCSPRSPHYRWGFTPHNKTVPSRRPQMGLCVVSSPCRSVSCPASLLFAYISLQPSRGRWDLS